MNNLPEQSGQDTPEIEIGGTTPEIESDAMRAFGSTVAELVQTLPEVAQERAAIEAGGRKLIEEHGLAPELFDKAHTVFFAAIAQRYARLEQKKSQMPREQYEQEEGFIHDTTVMLAWDKQAGFNELKWQIDADVAAEVPGKEKQAYDTFTDKDMTARLKRVIDEGLFKGVHENMGHAEVPYDLHVLDIGFTENRLWDDHNTLGIDDAEKQRLANNAVLFREEGHMAFAGRSQGWVVPIDGKRVLALPKPVAAMLLPENGEPDEESLKIAAHEYAHTQGDLTLDDQKLSYGALFEERRADIASDGDRYGVIERFMDVDLYLASGSVLSHTVRTHMFDADPGAFWTAVAADMGLGRTLELGLAVTPTFINQKTRPLQARVNAYLGGLDGIVQRIYDANTSDLQRQAEMNARIAPHVAWLENMSAPDAEIWVQYCKSSGIGFMISVLQEQSQRIAH